MLGERLDAQRLHALGLVNEITGNGQALTHALALAARLNARAPNSIASIKELLGEARGASFVSQLSQERDHFVRNLRHANAGIGIAAFLAKERPRYE
jgi:enoyl-CoA hydratase/carnithine racemase